MKVIKLVPYLALCILLVNCTTNRENTEEIITELHFTNEITSFNNGKSITGKIDILNNLENETIISVIGEKDRKVFHLQKFKESEHTQELNKLGQVIYFKDIIFIVPEGSGKVLSFAGNFELSKSTLERFTQLYSGGIEIKYVAGLATYNFTKDEITDLNIEKDKSFLQSLAELRNAPLKTMTDCDSGGKGSTSCSVASSPSGSCSVSCGSGYYACCVKVTANCTCEPEKPSGSSS